MAPGLLIAVEGLDGSGKSTQVRQLAAYLTMEGREVVSTCEPTSGPVGTMIRSMLADDDVDGDVLTHLFAADRAEHLRETILPALWAGHVVITDRYYHSMLAHQARSVGWALVEQLSVSCRAPDLTLWLDVPPRVAWTRIQERGQIGERYESLDELKATHQGYINALEWCRSRGERLVRVPASASQAHVAGLVRDEVDRFLAERALTHEQGVA